MSGQFFGKIKIMHLVGNHPYITSAKELASWVDGVRKMAVFAEIQYYLS